MKHQATPTLTVETLNPDSPVILTQDGHSGQQTIMLTRENWLALCCDAIDAYKADPISYEAWLRSGRQ